MKTIGLIITAILLSISSYAQDKKAIFIGFQPSITAEPFYAEGEFDVNVLPAVILTPLSKRIDFRATTLLNYHLGPKINLGWWL